MAYTNICQLSFHVKHEARDDLRSLESQVSAWGMSLTPGQLSSLERYASLLAEYEQANVIGTRDKATILLDHLADALSCSLTGCISGGKSLVDVGSGNGLPGIPLRLAYPEIGLTLLEATAKKVRFLDWAVLELDLSGVETVNQRAETAGHAACYRDSFDVAVAQAVAALPVVLEYCAPFVKRGGAVIAMKGDLVSEEIRAGERAAAALGAELEEIHQVEFLPELVQKGRRLLVFRKRVATPEHFPRRVGVPKQRPLGVQGG